jgi:hypothetical protein
MNADIHGRVYHLLQGGMGYPVHMQMGWNDVRFQIYRVFRLFHIDTRSVELPQLATN